MPVRFITDNLPSVLVGFILFALIALAIAARVRSRRKSKGCGMGCAGCPAAGVKGEAGISACPSCRGPADVI